MPVSAGFMISFNPQINERVRGCTCPYPLRCGAWWAWLRPARPWLRRPGTTTSVGGDTWIRPALGEDVRRIYRASLQAGDSWTARGQRMVAFLRSQVHSQYGAEAVAVEAYFAQRVQAEVQPRQLSDAQRDVILARAERDAWVHAGDCEEAESANARLVAATAMAAGGQCSAQRRQRCLTEAAAQRTLAHARSGAAGGFYARAQKVITKYCRKAASAAKAVLAAVAVGSRPASSSTAAPTAASLSPSSSLASGGVVASPGTPPTALAAAAAVEPAHPAAAWRAQRRERDPTLGGTRRRLDGYVAQAERTGPVHAAGFGFSPSVVARAAAHSAATGGVTGPAPRLDEALSIL